MEFKKEDLQDWVFEHHDEYWDTHLDIKDMRPLEGDSGKIVQHINGDYFVRVFCLDADNYSDYWDYPIEDYKAWLRDRQINKLLQ